MTENHNLENHNLESRREEVRLLVVSRESSLLRLLWSLEEASPWHLSTAANGWDAMERLQSEAAPHLLVLDISRGDVDSLHFLRWVRRLNRDLPVVLLCHPEEAAQAKEEMRKGAGEILIRPFETKQLEFVIRRQFAPAAEAEDNMVSTVSKDIEPLGDDIFFVGASLIMQKLRAQAALMAKTDVPVLILGERGAGKFTVASLIHNLSVRSGFKLRRINCAQMPESVLEGELFGGDATRGSSGRVAAGEKGTIFLDEITALPASLQAKLVQILQNDELRGAAAISAPLRIVAASSLNLERALAEKWLREDLYYRLSAFTVHVPPLRQRKDEIPILLRYFMHQLAKHYSLPPRTFTAGLLEACQRYSWPGNLREMETFVKRYLVAGDTETAMREMSLPSDEDGALPAPRWPVEAAEEEIAAEAKEARPESLKSLIQGIKSEAEKNAIRAALKTTGWNRKAAARLLRVSYRTLLYKIEQYQMRAPEPFLSSFPAAELLSYEEVKGNGKAS
ncbi:MAG: sigma 54-interacting transcriptional regulator [Candidatus Sulfotelmatobacter sp.]